MSDTATVTLAEAVRVLAVPREGLARLFELVEPFKPDAAGYLTPRQCFGLSLVCSLPFCEAGTAILIATTAAGEADASGNRLLAVAMLGDAVRFGWVSSGGVTDDLRRPVLVLPIDHLFAELSARLAHGEPPPVRLVN